MAAEMKPDFVADICRFQKLIKGRNDVLVGGILIE